LIDCLHDVDDDDDFAAAAAGCTCGHSISRQMLHRQLQLHLVALRQTPIQSLLISLHLFAASVFFVGDGQMLESVCLPTRLSVVYLC